MEGFRSYFMLIAGDMGTKTEVEKLRSQEWLTTLLVSVPWCPIIQPCITSHLQGYHVLYLVPSQFFHFIKITFGFFYPVYPSCFKSNLKFQRLFDDFRQFELRTTQKQ